MSGRFLRRSDAGGVITRAARATLPLARLNGGETGNTAGKSPEVIAPMASARRGQLLAAGLPLPCHNERFAQANSIGNVRKVSRRRLAFLRRDAPVVGLKRISSPSGWTSRLFPDYVQAVFELVSDYQPAGDQPQAIAKLTEGIVSGAKHQTLLGVTGSGKTFTVANVIRNVDKPTLVISHNKTLAAQLYAEFKSFFPHNAVEYFVSYFDYYQPEAYIPRTDTFIEKDSSRNEEIERLRLSTMSSLFSRRDVIVVASVSCIYGIGSKEDYEEMIIPMRVGNSISREQFLSRLISLQYERNDITFERGNFRVRGDTVEVRPAGREDGLRVEFFGDEIA